MELKSRSDAERSPREQIEKSATECLRLKKNVNGLHVESLHMNQLRQKHPQHHTRETEGKMSEVKGQNTPKTLKTTILQATLKFICKKKKKTGAKLLKLQQQLKRKLERK